MIQYPFNLLFFAAVWIMVIAARAGVLGVQRSKVHAAYSLGANKWQILRYVILPNALPDISPACASHSASAGGPWSPLN